MRISPAQIITVLSVCVAGCLVSACKDDEPAPGAVTVDGGGISSGDGGGGTTPGPDGGTTPDPSAKCPGTTATPNLATVDALHKILGGWRWSKKVTNGTDSDFVDECDTTIGYHFGPDVVAEATYDYAYCTVARGGLAFARGGNYNAPPGKTCTELACSGEIGLLMYSDKSAGIFSLGPDGKPKGLVAFYFSLVVNQMGGIDLIQSNTGGNTQNGTRLTRHVGNLVCK